MNEAASRQLFQEHISSLSNLLLRERHWQLLESAYPRLDIGFFAQNRPALRLSLLCDNWNELPPAIRLLNLDGTPVHHIPRDPSGLFNHSPHPGTGTPFICSVGSREYHTHPSHVCDPWENYRTKSGYDLGGILTKIWRAWLKAKQ
jgi:hypothetical protein